MMINFTVALCVWAFNHSGIVPAAFIVASLNMLVQIMFSLVFGDKRNIKMRGAN